MMNQTLKEWENQMALLSVSDQKQELQKIITQECQLAEENQQFLPLQPLGPSNPGMKLVPAQVKRFSETNKELEILSKKKNKLGQLIYSKK